MLGNRIRGYRIRGRMTQEQLAEKMDVSRQAVAKWESGEAVPELEKLLQLTGLLQVTLDELARGERPCAGKPAGNKVPEQQHDIVEFLLLAGRATYAGKGNELAKPSTPGAHEYEYSKGDWRYRDRYFGGLQFAGEETVFRNERCQWVMHYSGRTVSEKFNPDFLKAALLRRPSQAPYRGPAFFRDGRFAYHNEADGNFDWFIGKEAIFCDDELVYECRYHGGLVSST